MYLFVVLINAVAGSSKINEKDDRKFLTKHKPCSRKRLDYPNGKNRKLSRAVAETAGIFETVDLDNSQPKVHVQSHVKFVYPQLPITITPSSSSRRDINKKADVCVPSTSSASQQPCVQQEREKVERVPSPDIFNDEDFINDFLVSDFPNSQQVADFSNTQQVNAVFEEGDGDVLDCLYKNLPSESQVKDPLYLPEVPAAPQVASASTARAHDRLPEQNFTLSDIRKLGVLKLREFTNSIEKKQEDLRVRIAMLQSEFDELEAKKKSSIEETKRLESSWLVFEGNL